MTKAIFFDRDGVVNRRIVGDYVKTPEQFVFIDDFFELFKFIKNKDYLAILVTNQQGIGKSLMTNQDLAEVHEYMNDELLERTGFAFDEIYFCPDLATNPSSRRKPQPGMFFEAIEKYKIDTSESWTIGDSTSDTEAGKHAGTQTVLLGSHEPNEFTDFIFPDITILTDYFRKNLN